MKLPIWLWLILPLAILLWSTNKLFSAYRDYHEARVQVLTLEKEVEILTQRLPKALAKPPLQEEALPLLYQTLFHLAEETGLTVGSLNPGQVEAVGEDEAWKLVLEVEGSYYGIVTYLKTLSSLDKPLWVERYALTPLQATQGKRLLLSLTLRIRAASEQAKPPLP
ncbi:type 4a pilus biogenesis protein PilO [Calidithermus timidus]|jgi:Tfp pilus assembly protein PilO|uniref:type 4a pilus biogenesis protein PilO n=1 Tax=Calidithermus timidus TaxID=307124 RepID=UPI000363B171|nr:type 4a pilus biogenesis protein PilO [Calidithermus timidus]